MQQTTDGGRCVGRLCECLIAGGRHHRGSCVSFEVQLNDQHPWQTVRSRNSSTDAQQQHSPAVNTQTASTVRRINPFATLTARAGGLLSQAQVEEFHVITWESKKEQIFEMPTGGAAIMRQGPNLLKLARKEQCLALLAQLRTKFKIDGFIYRVFPNGEVQYLHPKVRIF